MKRIKWIMAFVFMVMLLSACQSVKTIQRQMQGIQSELFYELTTPVYSGNIDNTIYLSLVEDTVSLMYTTVNRKSRKVLPLLFYNLEQYKYEVTLGEASLIQSYHEFLMDALFTQCNRSSCFNLKVKDETILPDSALILEVKVNRNITAAKMVSKEFSYVFPFYGAFVISSSGWEINQPVSWLGISVRLIQQEKCLWEKTYIDTQNPPYKRQGIEKPVEAYETCIDYLTECLSYTTKGIVENISQDLHLMMLEK